MIPKSNEIRFETTTKCNYNCLICPRERLTRKIETMSLKLFKYIFDKLVDETEQYDTVSFPGMGEPLLDRSIDQKIAHVKKKGFKVLILTNGSLLSLARFKRLERLGVDSLRVSLYGNTPASHNKIHGLRRPGAFNRIKQELSEISDKKRKTKLLLTYNVVEGVNQDDLNPWISYWQDKADLIEVWRPHNWVGARAYRKIQKKKLNSCGRPFKTPLQIQVDGTVNMCCFDFNGELLLGDLKTQSLKEIFSSAMFKKILRHHQSGNFKNSGLICRHCDQRNADKSKVMVYSSNFDIKQRVKMVSTVYSKLI
ncbi:radical SAM/SPASM domain-containing protein [Candidatus Omnitrophota bacterium]